MDELNEALLWLLEHRGRIIFSLSVQDRIRELEPPATVVEIVAASITDDAFDDSDETADVEPWFGSCEVSAGNVAGALLAAINKARSQGAGSETRG